MDNDLKSFHPEMVESNKFNNNHLYLFLVHGSIGKSVIHYLYTVADEQSPVIYQDKKVS